MMDILAQIASTGGPSVLALTAFYLLLRRDMREVKEDVRDLRDDHRTCQQERRASETELHGRCTANATELARLKGRMNGNGHG
jgi:hypothetical protein